MLQKCSLKPLKAFLVFGLILSPDFLKAESVSAEPLSAGVKDGTSLSTPFEPESWPYSSLYLRFLKVEGCEKTEEETVVRISRLKVGAELGRHDLIRAKKNLLSSGLFSRVSISGKKSPIPNQIDVQIEVEEKVSWFLAPYFALSGGKYGGGAAIGETNLFGRAIRAAAGGQWTYNNRAAFAGIRHPSLFDSVMTLSVDGLFRWQEMTEAIKDVEIRNILLVEKGFTVLPGIQWTQDFNLSIGIYWRDIDISIRKNDTSQRALAAQGLKEGKDIAGTLRLEFQEMNEVQGLKDGFQTNFEAQVSDSRYFSQFNYSLQKLSLTYAVRWDNFHQVNLLSKFVMGLGQNLPFYREFTIGGPNLRGYDNEAFRGDTRYSLYEELYFPLYRASAFLIRGIIFWDSGIIYFKESEFSRNKWRNGVGGGFRLYLHKINIPLIGYDFAYGAESGQYHHYLQIGKEF